MEENKKGFILTIIALTTTILAIITTVINLLI